MGSSDLYDFPEWNIVAPLQLGFQFAEMVVILIVLLVAWRRQRLSALGREDVVALLPAYQWLLRFCGGSAMIVLIWGVLPATSERHVLVVVGAFVGALYETSIHIMLVFLLQRAAGTHAVRRTLLIGAGLGVWSFSLDVIGVIPLPIAWVVSSALDVLWYTTLVCVYLVLACAPAATIMRRPAVYKYAGFCSLIWVASCVNSSIDLSVAIVLLGRHFEPSDYLWLQHPATLSLVTVMLSIYFITPPLIMYLSMIKDSEFWQGIHVSTSSNLQDAIFQVTSPLQGMRYTSSEAAQIADGIDTAVARAKVQMLNFAALGIDGNLLGAGGQARVYHGTLRGERVAVKVVFCIELSVEVINDFCKEAAFLTELKHPKIVHVYGVCVVPPTLGLVLELCTRGSLTDYLSDPNTRLTLVEKLQLCIDCTEALAYMHSHGMIHCDIKSANFLVTATGQAKLSDLGLAKSMQQQQLGTDKPAGPRRSWLLQGVAKPGPLAASGFSGTVAWASPEVLRGSPHSVAADVYALTIVLWEIFAQQLPFQTKAVATLSSTQLSDAVLGKGDWRSLAGATPPNLVTDGLRPPMPLNAPPTIVQLLDCGWHHDPAQRWSMPALLQQLTQQMSAAKTSPLGSQPFIAVWHEDSLPPDVNGAQVVMNPLVGVEMQ